jgi:formate dehydrogenase major subunit
VSRHANVAADNGLSIHDGDVVQVSSRYGSARLPARVDAALRSGELFATFNHPATLLNAVTGPNRDAVVDTPEYKLTAVQVERVAVSPPGSEGSDRHSV